MTVDPTDRHAKAPSIVDDGRPFRALYDRAVTELLEVSVEETRVETRAGRTHLLLAGDREAPPVFVLQDGNVTDPVTLAWVQGLADDYRLVAPDTPDRGRA